MKLKRPRWSYAQWCQGLGVCTTRVGMWIVNVHACEKTHFSVIYPECCLVSLCYALVSQAAQKTVHSPIDPSFPALSWLADHHGSVESLDTSQFLLLSASSRHSRRKMWGPIFTLQSQQTTLESIHILTMLICVPEYHHYKVFFTQSFCPVCLS